MLAMSLEKWGLKGHFMLCFGFDCVLSTEEGAKWGG